MSTTDAKEWRHLEQSARAVCALFGDENDWPRIEVMVTRQDRPTLPLSDDDADRVRSLRRALRNLPPERAT